MKPLTITSCMSVMLLHLLFLAPPTLQAQEKMPVTSFSTEAMDFYRQGIQHLKKHHYSEAQTLFKKVTDQDASFAMAFLCHSFAQNRMNYVSPVVLQKISSPEIRLSQGEKKLIALIHSFQTGEQEKVRPHEGWNNYQKAIQLIEKEDLNQPTRQYFKTLGHIWELYALTSMGDLKGAQAKQTVCQKMVSAHTNLTLEQTYLSICGRLEIAKGNFRAAIQKLSQSWQRNPMVWYYTGMAWEKSGNHQEAKKWYNKVVNFRNNSLDLAVTRNRALADLKK